MIIECPEYGAKNQTTQPPQPGKRYRCGKCGAVITFLQTTDSQDTSTAIQKEKTPIEARGEVQKEQAANKRKTQFREAPIPKTPLFLIILALFFVPGVYIILALSVAITIAVGGGLIYGISGCPKSPRVITPLWQSKV